MHFASFSDFLAMGGYATYVWSAFGITFLALAWVIIAAVITRRGIINDINKTIAREQRIENAKNMENTL